MNDTTRVAVTEAIKYRQRDLDQLRERRVKLSRTTAEVDTEIIQAKIEIAELREDLA